MPAKRKSDTKVAAAETNGADTDEEKQTNKRSRRSDDPKPVEKGLKFDLDWSTHGKPLDKSKFEPLLCLTSKTEPGCTKVAGFDIDHTVIVTKSGRSFATNAQDWKWFDSSVPSKLKELHENGYRVLFVTNQAGIEKGKVKFATELKPKFEAMVKELDIPVFILISTGENHFRKPATEIWKYFLENCNKGVVVDEKESFYVGDAAGRPKNWAPGKNKDFSCTDRMFAANVGIQFYTPEEFFLKHKAVKFEWGSIDPNEFLEKHATSKNGTEEKKKFHSDGQELVLLVGPPASGKSTFFKRNLSAHNYVHINRDTLSTQAACMKAAEAALTSGKSVCIDNTNPSRKARTEYLELAKRHKVPNVRCIVIETPIELCHHLNYVRQSQTRGNVRRIPDVGYNVYKGQFEEPKLEEGFTKIEKVAFSPEFESKDHEKVFRQWTS